MQAAGKQQDSTVHTGTYWEVNLKSETKVNILDLTDDMGPLKVLEQGNGSISVNL